ncbi:hypothetical protein [Cohnella panacarvi]|uniref:hypothetical protein n=1 Tax=Cohnella panacarvi TaxID=400776 RepID=UPI00047D74A2|nr:hypothetical protein [Cohnella panacarvi]
MNKVLRKSAVSVLAAAAIVTSFATVSAAERGVSVQVNGKAITSSSNAIFNGKTYVDLAAFSKTTGIKYVYDASKKTAVVGGIKLKVIVKGGKPTVAVRDLAAAAGFSGVGWNAESLTATLKAGNLTVFGDAVSQNLGCVLTSRFAVGDAIVFRMKAVDAKGKLAKDAQLQVKLGTGETIDMVMFEEPGMPEDMLFWRGVYRITEETPKGVLRYSVTAQSATAQGTFEPFNVEPSLITIVAAEEAPASDEAPATEEAPAAN